MAAVNSSGLYSPISRLRSQWLAYFVGCLLSSLFVFKGINVQLFNCRTDVMICYQTPLGFCLVLL